VSDSQSEQEETPPGDDEPGDAKPDDDEKGRPKRWRPPAVRDLGTGESTDLTPDDEPED
jgi:hypothetical protein